MNYEKFKKKLSGFLAVLMVLGTLVLPTSVYADEEDDTVAASADLSETSVIEADVDSTDVTASEEETSTEQYTASYNEQYMEMLLGADSYQNYKEDYAKVPKATQTVVINAVESFNEQASIEASAEEDTTLTYSVAKASDLSTEYAYDSVKEHITGKDGADDPDVLVTGNEGCYVFDVDIPETGKYAMRITYSAEAQSVDEDEASAAISTTIERMLYVDGSIPFSETRYLYFPRCWYYEYEEDDDGYTKYEADDGTVYYLSEDGTDAYILNDDDTKTPCDVDDIDGYIQFQKDKNGNDTRPRRWEKTTWQTYYVRDWLGYEIDPLEFYFTEGEHTITLHSNRESMVVYTIELYPYEEEISYEDYIEQAKANGAEEITDIEDIKLQGENPEYVSVQNVFPANDRTSALSEPQDPAHIRYNYLDTPTVNNWMRYSVTVPKSGLYSISFRFRQNTLIGLFTSRRIKVNGEIPFREASYLRFDYNTSWQTQYASDGKTDQFLFYLEEGENTIELEVVLGYMVQYVYDIEQTIESLQDAYQTLLMITGAVPDTYRDYGFGRLCPEAIDAIAKGADTLIEIEDSIVELTGSVGDQSNALGTISDLLTLMARDEYEIAGNLVTFKNYIISLEDWLYQALSQPLKLDYIVVGGADYELDRPIPTTLGALGFEVVAFVSSFSMDYTTIGFRDDAATLENEVIEMWAVSDRESMLIQRYVVDNYFTPESHISLRIKVISAGLTEAILAGIGPDVSFLDTVNTITFGMRTAIEPLEDFDGFDELMKSFPEAMMDKLTMVGQDNIEHTYGLPTTLVFSMAFFRTDVLSELGLDIPDSWDELYSVMSTLGYNNLQVGLPTGLVGTELFLFQQDDGNETLYKDDGKAINLDSNNALAGFTQLCEMFTKYSSPAEYEITRFRTGEIPIMIAEDAITIYNQLMTYYELRGLWQMTPVIGTVESDGTTICRNTIANTNAMIMPRGDGNKETIWEFMKWYCGDDAMTRFARESIAVSSPTSKYSTANLSALLSQKWTDQERSAIEAQLNSLVGVPEYPGAYIVNVYANFAFLDAYNYGTDPSEAMLDQILDINKEISRKREEFGLEAYEVNYGNQVNEQSNASNTDE